MKNSTHRLNHLLLAAAVALLLLSVTSAVRSADMSADHRPAMEEGRGGGHGGGPDGPDGGAGGRGSMGPPPGAGFSFGPGPGPGFGPQAPLFRGVELTEAQEDRIFAILHAEKPYLREQAKAAGKAHEALRALAETDKYDDAKAAALAQAAATASANIELQHVRTRQKLLAVLTPEQRKQQDQERPDDRPRRQRP
ncbi:Spy/CpxP family protein refolding chaperone [Duganella sp. FT27W]|uniref:Spy/CpxP family protein refolding chaperone n=1 Tax=Duganella sp. FT27W TaxID=2654636 RepID=UPI00128E3860|nr:periplasmic heavy metal sensor [Duganella sp. FT27W]MPQ57424.1 periplasmic heavy metal sensor [Duganella sp. FT27W]